MSAKSSRRSALALLTLVLAWVASVGPVSAATWDTPLELWTGATVVDIVAVGNTTLVAGLRRCIPFDQCEVRIVRSTNSGASWSVIKTLFVSNWDPGPYFASYGTSVDAVWVNARHRLKYTHSTDSGATWSPAVKLSDGTRRTTTPSVARGANGQVAVAWQYPVSTYVAVRVSSDGGATFGSQRQFTTSGATRGTSVAIGATVVYIAYYRDGSKLRLRRSVDAGTSWSSPVAVNDDVGDHGVSLTAWSSYAYVAYTVPTGEYTRQARYRRTVNFGASWSDPLDLSPAGWSVGRPDIELRGGVLRATLNRNVADETMGGAIDYRVYYRQSADGLTWATPERVSPVGILARDGRLSFGSKVAVLYTHDWTDGSSWYSNAFLRTASP